jgi:hypothetical protein
MSNLRLSEQQAQQEGWTVDQQGVVAIGNTRNVIDLISPVNLQDSIRVVENGVVVKTIPATDEDFAALEAVADKARYDPKRHNTIPKAFYDQFMAKKAGLKAIREKGVENIAQDAAAIEAKKNIDQQSDIDKSSNRTLILLVAAAVVTLFLLKMFKLI